MSKDKYSQLVVISNEDVVDVSFLYLNYNNIVDYNKHDIVKNIKFKSITTSIKTNFLLHHIVDFVIALELSYQKIKVMGP